MVTNVIVSMEHVCHLLQIMLWQRCEQGDGFQKLDAFFIPALHTSGWRQLGDVRFMLVGGLQLVMDLLDLLQVMLEVIPESFTPEEIQRKSSR